MSDLHLEVFGEGESAVFVHGSFGWGLDTFPHQRALADRYRVILLDRRGFGRSPSGDPDGWPTDMYDVAAVLEEAEGAHLVGQSYGGVVALLTAGLRPDLVRSLVVIEPPSFGVASGDADVQELVRAVRPLYEKAPTMSAQEFATTWARSRGGDPERWTATFSDDDWAAAEATRRETWPGDAPIALETLAASPFRKVVVAGAWPSDAFPGRQTTARAHRAVCDALAAHIGAELVVFERSGHNPQLEEPERFNDLLRTVWASSAK